MSEAVSNFCAVRSRRSTNARASRPKQPKSDNSEVPTTHVLSRRISWGLGNPGLDELSGHSENRSVARRLG
jgi:hypothetical protein